MSPERLIFTGNVVDVVQFAPNVYHADVPAAHALAIGCLCRLALEQALAGQPADHFKSFAPFMTLDIPMSSGRARQLLDRKREHPGLIADLDQGHYLSAERSRGCASRGYRIVIVPLPYSGLAFAIPALMTTSGVRWRA